MSPHGLCQGARYVQAHAHAAHSCAVSKPTDANARHGDLPSVSRQASRNASVASGKRRSERRAVPRLQCACRIASQFHSLEVEAALGRLPRQWQLRCQPKCSWESPWARWAQRQQPRLRLPVLPQSAAPCRAPAIGCRAACARGQLPAGWRLHPHTCGDSSRFEQRCTLSLGTLQEEKGRGY